MRVYGIRAEPFALRAHLTYGARPLVTVCDKPIGPEWLTARGFLTQGQAELDRYVMGLCENCVALARARRQPGVAVVHVPYYGAGYCQPWYGPATVAVLLREAHAFVDGVRFAGGRWTYADVRDYLRAQVDLDYRQACQLALETFNHFRGRR